MIKKLTIEQATYAYPDYKSRIEDISRYHPKAEFVTMDFRNIFDGKQCLSLRALENSVKSGDIAGSNELGEFSICEGHYCGDWNHNGEVNYITFEHTEKRDYRNRRLEGIGGRNWKQFIL